MEVKCSILMRCLWSFEGNFAHYDATTSWYSEYMNNLLLHMMISVDKKSIGVKKGFERVVNSDMIA
jgi:hypothetical protein